MSIAAMFRARARPSRVPREAASRTLASGISSLGLTWPSVSGFSVSGIISLAIRIVPGAVMTTAVRMCRISTLNATYAAMIPPETWAMPGRHHGEQLRAGHLRQVGPDRERGLGLADEDRGGDVQRLGPARPHQLRHHDGDPADDPLHQRPGDRAPRRRRRRRSPSAGCGTRRRSRRGRRGRASLSPKTNREPTTARFEHPLDDVARPLDRHRPPVPLEHEEGEAPLERQAPEEDPLRDRPPVARRSAITRPRITTIPRKPRSRSVRAMAASPAKRGWAWRGWLSGSAQGRRERP